MADTIPIPWPHPAPNWTRMTMREIADRQAEDFAWLVGYWTQLGRHDSAKNARHHIGWSHQTLDKTSPFQGTLFDEVS